MFPQNQLSQAARATRDVHATLAFTPRIDGLEWFAADRGRSEIPMAHQQVLIRDARDRVEQFTLDANGFALLNRPIGNLDLHDKDAVESRYVPQIQALARELTGAEMVVCFGTVVRSDGESGADLFKPARQAHVDFDGDGVRDIAHELLGAEADRWLSRRFIQMNFWRPIKTVLQAPLALADASTIQEADFVSVAIHGGLGDPGRRPFNSRRVVYRPGIEWWYASDMTPDEIWAFKLYDSDPSKVQFTAHTAFDDPDTPEHAPPRESIEVRTISFLPD